MPDTKQLSIELIEQALNQQGWRYVLEESCFFHVVFSLNKQLGLFHAYYGMIGQKMDQLYCFGYYAHEIHNDQIATSIYLANEFNSNHSTPSIFVRREGDNRNRYACQVSYRLSYGTNHEILNDILLSFAHQGKEFGLWLLGQSLFR